MPRLDFEKQFQKEMNSRKITPSEGSWEKLSRQLKTKDRKRIKPAFWVGIAAAMAGAVLLLNFLMDRPVPESRQIVSDPSVEFREVKSAGETGNQVTLESVTPEKNKREEIVSSQPDIPERTKMEPVKRKNASVPVIVEAIQITAPVSEGNISQNSAVVDNQVTDSEIDALLSQATERINSGAEDDFANYNARELLREVERDLERSFRQQLFEVLKDGLIEARTALANRNF